LCAGRPKIDEDGDEVMCSLTLSKLNMFTACIVYTSGYQQLNNNYNNNSIYMATFSELHRCYKLDCYKSTNLHQPTVSVSF